MRVRACVSHPLPPHDITLPTPPREPPTTPPTVPTVAPTTDAPTDAKLDPTAPKKLLDGVAGAAGVRGTDHVS